MKMLYQSIESRLESIAQKLTFTTVGRLLNFCGVTQHHDVGSYMVHPRSLKDFIVGKDLIVGKVQPSPSLTELNRIAKRFDRNAVALFDLQSGKFIENEGFGKKSTDYLSEYIRKRIIDLQPAKELVENDSMTLPYLQELAQGQKATINDLEELAYYSGAVALFFPTKVELSQTLEFRHFIKPDDSGWPIPPNYIPLRIYDSGPGDEKDVVILRTTHGKYTVEKEDIKKLEERHIWVPSTYLINH